MALRLAYVSAKTAYGLDSMDWWAMPKPWASKQGAEADGEDE